VLGSGDFSRTPVAYSWIANRMAGGFGYRLAAPYGLMLAFDKSTVWGVRRTGRGYTMFCEPYPAGDTADPGPDFVRTDGRQLPPWHWSGPLGMRPRAMIRAGTTLVVGGADTASADPSHPHAAFDGNVGGVLWTFNSDTGEPVASIDLTAPPVWDGMAAARGTLYVATADGHLLQLKETDQDLPVPQVTVAQKPHDKPAEPTGTPAAPGKPIAPEKDGKLILTPATAKTTGRLRYQPDRNNLGAWIDPKDTCQWDLTNVKAGQYTVEFAYGSTNPDVEFTIRAGDQGNVTLTVVPGPFKGAIMNVRLLTLTPVK
jgi:hypothetical protein